MTLGCVTNQVKVENQAGLHDITSVVAIASCYCTMEPYVDSKYDLYIQKIGDNYRTFVYVSLMLSVCCLTYGIQQ